MKIKQNRRAFTIVELVIVIAVIAILAAVLIPTFSGIIDKANRSSAMQEARNAWNEVSYTYASGYDGFAYACDELNGWYYDYEDGVAKYTVDEKYTVTYDGENWVVNDIDGSAWVWDEITDASESFSDYTIDANPYALKVTYYTDIYSRGFAWITQNGVSDSKLYIVESNKGEEADFSGVSAITGTADTSRAAYTSHKAYVTNLSAGTVYSYKVGSESGWKYGTFKTEQSSITSITAIQLSDAQTKDSTKLNVWENTMAQAIETAGHGLDMILYNGDQHDNNQTGVGESVDKGVRYAIARDTIDDYVGSIPYMISTGNHEPCDTGSIVEKNNTIDYDGVTSENGKQGVYYSYDYGFAHFVVLNSNGDYSAQATWLRSDLANASSAKWIIVMIHFGPYATGDHLSGSKTLNDAFTSIFAEYKVDLVLQAHDHTYNKTLPYSWGTDKGQVSKTASAEEIANVINQNVTTTTYNGETYDLNPNGTYYVTTGAAGHRVGEDGDTYVKNYENNSPYKLICGTISVDSDYGNIGDEASTNLSVQMFGVLNLTETTLTYDFYAVDGNDVQLYDSLNIMKTN